ncbi:ROK family transcriptional regulator [Haloechinothrix salitolerans]|uniref:ROK family transcriptional regulator n=1 Tax=Haloechinothrix salitolerans TaxID=926830 RepID=A0ABW2BUM1_9PSEU
MQPMRTGSKELIREINASLVFRELRAAPLQSRTDLARHTGLSLSTVSEIVAGLLGSGIIEERETGRSAGGRKPVLLAVRPDAGYVVGIKLTETRAVAVLTDLDSVIVERTVTPIAETSVDAVTEAVVTAVRELLPKAGSRPVFGAGVGLAGVVDPAAGVVRHATYASWHDVDLPRLLTERVGLPVVVDNDVNTLVASEQWFGAGRDATDFAVVSIGRGVGLGMVLDGRLYRGASGGAGEFGHTKVTADGPRCACGGVGCLETLVGEPAIRAKASEHLGKHVTTDEVIDLARGGHDALRAIFTDVGRTLGTAVGNLVNLLNPKLVILTGEGTRAADLFRDGFDAALGDAVFDGLQQDLDVVVDTCDDETWAQGAAGLFLGELFQPKLRPSDAGRPSLTTPTTSD